MIGEEAVVKEEKGGVKDEGETRHSGTLTFVAVSISVTSDHPGIFLSTRSHTHSLSLSLPLSLTSAPLFTTKRQCLLV